MDKIEQTLREIDREIAFTDEQIEDLCRDRESMPLRIFTEEYQELSEYKKDLYEVRGIVEAFRMLE